MGREVQGYPGLDADVRSMAGVSYDVREVREAPKVNDGARMIHRVAGVTEDGQKKNSKRKIMSTFSWEVPVILIA